MPSPEVTHIDRGQERYDLVPEARRQGTVVGDRTKHLTKRQWYDTRATLAIERQQDSPLRVFYRAVEAIEANNPDGKLLEQLAGIGVITQIVVPVTPETAVTLASISDSAQTAYRSGTVDGREKEIIGKAFAQTLEQDFNEPEKERIAIIAIRALRNLAAITPDLIAQFLLWETVGQISFSSLQEMYRRAADYLHQGGKKESLVSELRRADQFISAAQKGVKKTRDPEAPLEVIRRSQIFCRPMVLLAQEHLSRTGLSSASVQHISRQMLEASFAHQLHWADPRTHLLNMCVELLYPSFELSPKINLTPIAAQLILDTHRAKLVNFDQDIGNARTFSKRDYDDLGLTDFYDDHRQLATQILQPVYIKDPRSYLRRQSTVISLSCFANVPHLGYRALVAGTRQALQDLHPEQDSQILVSLNRDDTLRRVGARDGTKPPVTAFEDRKRMATMTFAGVVDNQNIIFSSMEELVDATDVETRLREFGRVIGGDTDGRGGKILGRTQGQDRWNLNQAFHRQIFIALRGLDLLRLIRDPCEIDQMRTHFPNSEIHFLLLGGMTPFSSTHAYNLAHRYLTTHPPQIENLYGLRAMTHPNVTDYILNLIKRRLRNQGQRELVN
ncbi:MAG TPA: hypothetical protein VMW41_06875 [Candidatus Bathyarchaeia archaeon]|nr:hypothetical protein [Candidatus Bathyarchaeia archaeon]